MSDTENASIRLYTYAMSPYAAKVHCFLLYKGLDFECFYINPLRVRKDLPVGRQVPVVTVDGESRADSTPIGLWLDERFPDRPRLLPEGGEERERLLAADDWVTNHLIPGSFRSYPGEGIDRVLNGWKLSHVMANTARGGLPRVLRAAWPFFIKRVGFVRRLVAQADNGLISSGNGTFFQRVKRTVDGQIEQFFIAQHFAANRVGDGFAQIAQDIGTTDGGGMHGCAVFNRRRPQGIRCHNRNAAFTRPLRGSGHLYCR